MGRFFYSGREFLFSLRSRNVFLTMFWLMKVRSLSTFFSTSVFSEIRTKFKPLLRTDFSESESEKFPGMVTKVLRISGD